MKNIYAEIRIICKMSFNFVGTVTACLQQYSNLNGELPYKDEYDGAPADDCGCNYDNNSMAQLL